MPRNRAVILAAVVITFLAVFGYLVSRNTGGGGLLYTMTSLWILAQPITKEV